VTGTPFRPDRMTRLFAKLVAASGLPPVTLHGLRHGAATLAPAAGADLKVVQDQLGHSIITLTADTYTSVLPETARTAADHTAALLFPARQPKTCANAGAQETSGMGASGPPHAPPLRLTALRRRHSVGIGAISADMHARGQRAGSACRGADWDDLGSRRRAQVGDG
jgi:Phage integrase family